MGTFLFHRAREIFRAVAGAASASPAAVSAVRTLSQKLMECARSYLRLTGMLAPHGGRKESDVKGSSGTGCDSLSRSK